MRPGTLFVSALLLGCSEYDLKPGGPVADGSPPDIELSTNALEFGPVGAGEVDRKVVTVSNVGGSTLDVSDLVITTGADAFSVELPVPFEVEVGGSMDVEVAFTPRVTTNWGALSVRSNDPDEPDLPVDLLGHGNVPELALDPQDYVFPSGCEDTVYVKLQSVGTETLRIDALSFGGDADLALESGLTLPIDLPSGSEVGVIVRYTPSTGQPVSGALDVTSTDPRGVRTATQAGSPEIGEITESFVTEGEPPIDIVFALDKSGSMTEEMGSLANAFDDFIADIALVTTDWRIGVVSHDNGCFNNGIITPATPYYEDVFGDAVRGMQFLGTDLTEALLELTNVALWQTVPTGCNAGFSRADAVLHIVAVSDEPEQSGQPWNTWVSGYQAAKADPSLVVISSVVDMNNSCGSGAAGYLEASAATNGLVLDICTDAWGSYAAQLGAASVAALRTFALSAVPDPTSITVELDGVPYANGWHYDPVENAVVVDVDLPDGATLDVTYTALGC